MTEDANNALQFETRQQCEAWIRENTHPRLEAVEHGFHG